MASQVDIVRGRPPGLPEAMDLGIGADEDVCRPPIVRDVFHKQRTIKKTGSVKTTSLLTYLPRLVYYVTNCIVACYGRQLSYRINYDSWLRAGLTSIDLKKPLCGQFVARVGGMRK